MIEFSQPAECAMFRSIQFEKIPHYAALLQSSLLNFIEYEETKRIKEIAASIFNRLSSFFSSFGSQSKEMNLKPLAMISCLSLIAILVISFLRKGEDSIFPQTPMKNNG